MFTRCSVDDILKFDEPTIHKNNKQLTTIKMPMVIELAPKLRHKCYQPDTCATWYFHVKKYQI
jgi:hypothetical protein